MRILISMTVLAVLIASGPVVDASNSMFGVTQRVHADDVQQRRAELKDELEAGLKARRPEEFQFIARVVKLVEEGRLPLKLVRSTFVWARRKKPYPFPFFERAMIARAAQIGVQIK